MPDALPDQIIEVIVSADGKAQVTTKGFTGGQACHAASRPYEKALGVVTSDVLTAEGRCAPVNTVKPKANVTTG
jgi:hypothetical protein